MDSSGSLTKREWGKEEVFVKEMVQSALTNSSRVAAVQFATVNEVLWRLTDQQGADGRDAFVNSFKSVDHMDGWTYMRNGMTAAMDLFTEGGDAPGRLIVLITDGNPSTAPNGAVGNQSPCDLRAPYAGYNGQTLDDMGITVIIVGVGSGLDKDKVTCLSTMRQHSISMSKILAVLITSEH
jgi:Mg-chelatase subunit ChlD